MSNIPNLELLLSSNDINASIIALDNFVAEVCNYGVDVGILSTPQRLFYFNQNLEREVNNGGFDQYFINSSGNYAHETISSLEVIGAFKTAAILQKAIDQFPDKKVPTDRDQRIETIEQIKAIAKAVWGELDEEFFQYQDDLNQLNIEFIKTQRLLF